MLGHWSFHPRSVDETGRKATSWPQSGLYYKEQLYFCPDEDADKDESSGDTDTPSDPADSDEGRISEVKDVSLDIFEII